MLLFFFYRECLNVALNHTKQLLCGINQKQYTTITNNAHYSAISFNWIYKFNSINPKINLWTSFLCISLKFDTCTASRHVSSSLIKFHFVCAATTLRNYFFFFFPFFHNFDLTAFETRPLPEIYWVFPNFFLFLVSIQLSKWFLSGAERKISFCAKFDASSLYSTSHNSYIIIIITIWLAFVYLLFFCYHIM